MNIIWFTKKRMFLLSLVILLSSFLLNSAAQDFFWKKFSEAVFWITVPVLFFSLVTLFLKLDVFRNWLKFTLFFYLISLLLILMVKNSSGGMDFIPVGKESVSQLLSILYSLISLILIIFKSIQLRNKK